MPVDFSALPLFPRVRWDPAWAMFTCPAVWNASMAGSRRVERFAGESPAPGLAMVFAEGHVEDVRPGLASPRYRCSISARSARPACPGARPVTTQTICLLSRMEALIGRRRRQVSKHHLRRPGELHAGRGRGTKHAAGEIRPCPRSLQAWCPPISAASVTYILGLFWPVDPLLVSRLSRLGSDNHQR